MAAAAIDVACRARTELDTLAGLDQGVLKDIADGTCSVLEHGYLHCVVRAHRLPSGQRQVRDDTGTRVAYRDTAHASVTPT